MERKILIVGDNKVGINRIVKFLSSIEATLILNQEQDGYQINFKELKEKDPDNFKKFFGGEHLIANARVSF